MYTNITGRYCLSVAQHRALPQNPYSTRATFFFGTCGTRAVKNGGGEIAGSARLDYIVRLHHAACLRPFEKKS